MELAIVGTRFLNDKQKSYVEEKIKNIIKEKDYPKIVTGDATGVDSVARSMANKFNLELNVFVADWKKHGKSAGPKRNSEIVSNSDEMLAFWNGKSPGTKNSINQMKETNKPVVICDLNKMED